MANNVNEHMGGALLLPFLVFLIEIIFTVLLGGTTSMTLILSGYTNGANLSGIAHDAYLAFIALILTLQDFNFWSHRL